MTVPSVGGTESFVTKIAVSDKKCSLVSPILSLPFHWVSLSFSLMRISTVHVILKSAHAPSKSPILSSVPFIPGFI